MQVAAKLVSLATEVQWNHKLLNCTYHWNQLLRNACHLTVNRVPLISLFWIHHHHLHHHHHRHHHHHHYHHWQCGELHCSGDLIPGWVWSRGTRVAGAQISGLREVLWFCNICWKYIIEENYIPIQQIKTPHKKTRVWSRGTGAAGAQRSGVGEVSWFFNISKCIFEEQMYLVFGVRFQISRCGKMYLK